MPLISSNNSWVEIRNSSEIPLHLARSMLGVVALVMEPTSPRLHERKNASARVGNSYSNLPRKHHHIISHQSKGAITKPVLLYSKCMQMFRALKPCSNFFFTSGSLLPKSFCLAVVPQGTHPVKLQSGGCHGATAATWVNGTAKSMEKSCDTSITAKKYRQSSTSLPWYCPVLSEFLTGDSWKFTAPQWEQAQYEFSAAPITESNPRSPVVGFALLNGFFQFPPYLGDLEEGGIGRGRSLRHWMYINVYTRCIYISYIHCIYIYMCLHIVYMYVYVHVHICICISCNILHYTLS